MTTDQFRQLYDEGYSRAYHSDRPSPTRIRIHPESWYELLREERFHRLLTYNSHAEPVYSFAIIVRDFAVAVGTVVCE